MILAVDVDYRDSCAYAAGLSFDAWNDSIEKASFVSRLDYVNEYVPGQFYQRELPALLALIAEHKLDPEYIVIDGFVFLDAECRPGLGKYLYDALNQKPVIIGVAKRPFKGIPATCEVYRGSSSRPLYVTSVGVTLDQAKLFIQSMHGDYRIPDLLKKVDQICRESKTRFAQ